MDIKRILFPTDFSEPSNRALDHAIVLAHRFNAELVMLHVEALHAADPNNPNFKFPDLDELFAFIRMQAVQRMNQPDLPVVTGDIEITEKVKRGISAANEILEAIDEYKIDLVLMGTHGRSGLSHFLLGSTTEKVVHGARIPVLTIHHGGDIFVEKSGRYENILVPVDFSEPCKKAVKFSEEIASRFESKVFIQHVIEPTLAPRSLYMGDVPQSKMDNEQISRTEAALFEFVKEDLSGKVEYIISQGQVHHEINHTVIEKDIDLIIIADQGWNAIDRWLLGSTTEKLVRKSKVPVLTVR